ncbi:MAG: hypothetical protein KDC80_17680 [Saprospiraceae bacterium]|nr:hypothetical protein [Saprospiraceae bacterium]
MNQFIILFHFISICQPGAVHANVLPDYIKYHERIVEAECLIASEDFKGALQVYEELLNGYDFVFLRDHQIASQLALYLNQRQKAREFLLNGIRAGWTLKSIRKNAFLKRLRKDRDWKSIKVQYHTLNEEFTAALNLQLRKRVKKMFSRDQWKALGALFTFSAKAQDKYAERRFAPHSEKQIKEFQTIIDKYGYPGEKLIGNDFWMSTILSHHNSISTKYNRNDTLYDDIRPDLMQALRLGQISAFEYALIDEWYRATINDDKKGTYGILEGPLQGELEATNKRRGMVFLREIETQNRLVEIEAETGMDFYLEGHPWEGVEINIR